MYHDLVSGRKEKQLKKQFLDKKRLTSNFLTS